MRYFNLSPYCLSNFSVIISHCLNISIQGFLSLTSLSLSLPVGYVIVMVCRIVKKEQESVSR